MEPSEKEWEQANRLAKWMRLSLVPLAAVLAAILLLGRDHAAGAPVKTQFGATTQGREFKLGLDDHGRPAAFDTELVAICPTGRTVSMPWNATDGEGVHFRRDGDRLRVIDKSELWQLALDGRATDGGWRGTMRLVVHVEPETRDPYDCVSKNLRFSVRG